MRRIRSLVIVIVAGLLPVCIAADDFDPERTVQRAVNREWFLMQTIASSYSPVVETYIQRLQVNADGTLDPTGDDYYLGRVRISRGEFVEDFYAKSGSSPRKFLLGMLGEMQWNPIGFAAQLVIDPHFDQAHLSFRYVGIETLGSLRCRVFDVTPREGGSFTGRIWVEDQEFNIVRVKGRISTKGWLTYWFHFDQWRVQTSLGHWLPSHIFFEEPDFRYGAVLKIRFRAFTRFWWYYVLRPESASPSAGSPELRVPRGRRLITSTESAAWRRSAEDRVLERLTAAGLIGSPGEVERAVVDIAEKVLAANHIDLPNLRVRVLLSSPLESFVIGNTIVLSRGLLDVTPDNSSIALVLSRELARILTADESTLQRALNDVNDQHFLKKARFRMKPGDIPTTESRAVELFRNSPYSQGESKARDFLRDIEQHAATMPNLMRAYLGHGWYENGRVSMSSFATAEILGKDSALPLWSRIEIQPLLGETRLLPPAERPSQGGAFEIGSVYPALYIARAAANAEAPASETSPSTVTRNAEVEQWIPAKQANPTTAATSSNTAPQ